MTLKEAMRTVDRDERDAAICAALGLAGPGGYALREPDGRLMVWQTERDAEGDDGARACYRSHRPITEAEWETVCSLAWIEDWESA